MRNEVRKCFLEWVILVAPPIHVDKQRRRSQKAKKD